jgi:hypothetical protein
MADFGALFRGRQPAIAPPIEPEGLRSALP